MATPVKKRNWAFVIYPESAPADWVDKLQQTGLLCAISPLHDSDLESSETGEVKKAHFHVIACYAGPTSFNVVKSLTDTLNAPIPIPLEQVRGYYRYFTHLDNPEKFQYDPKEIKSINGFDIRDFSELTKTEIHKIKIRIQNFILERNIVEYADLLDILLDNDMAEEHEVAFNNTMAFNSYLKSRRYRVVKEPR